MDLRLKGEVGAAVTKKWFSRRKHPQKGHLISSELGISGDSNTELNRSLGAPPSQRVTRAKLRPRVTPTFTHTPWTPDGGGIVTTGSSLHPKRREAAAKRSAQSSEAPWRPARHRPKTAPPLTGVVVEKEAPIRGRRKFAHRTNDTSTNEVQWRPGKVYGDRSKGLDDDDDEGSHERTQRRSGKRRPTTAGPVLGAAAAKMKGAVDASNNWLISTRGQYGLTSDGRVDKAARSSKPSLVRKRPSTAVGVRTTGVVSEEDEVKMLNQWRPYPHQRPHTAIGGRRGHRGSVVSRGAIYNVHGALDELPRPALGGLNGKWSRGKGADSSSSSAMWDDSSDEEEDNGAGWAPTGPLGSDGGPADNASSVSGDEESKDKENDEGASVVGDGSGDGGDVGPGNDAKDSDATSHKSGTSNGSAQPAPAKKGLLGRLGSKLTSNVTSGRRRGSIASLRRKS